MKKTLSLRSRWLLAVLMLALTLPHPEQAKILDPHTHHAILQEIADSLDRYGIDVVQDWRSHVLSRGRPIVAPLANFPVFSPLKDEAWMREFEQGLVGALVAFKPSGDFKHDTFRQQWHDVPVGQRIFISYAREDKALAEITRTILVDKGYVVFTYLKDPQRTPSYSPLRVGEYFGTAGTHVVIDTPVARQKPGVIREALALVNYGSVLPGNDSAISGGVPLNNHPFTGKSIFGSIGRPIELLMETGTLNPTSSRGTRHTRAKAVVNARAVVEIYGATDCERTEQALQIFRDAGADVRYRDVNKSRHAGRVLLRNRRWLVNELLPFVRVNGQPIRFTNEGVTRALQSIRAANP